MSRIRLLSLSLFLALVALVPANIIAAPPDPVPIDVPFNECLAIEAVAFARLAPVELVTLHAIGDCIAHCDACVCDPGAVEVDEGPMCTADGRTELLELEDLSPDLALCRSPVTAAHPDELGIAYGQRIYTPAIDCLRSEVRRAYLYERGRQPRPIARSNC